MDKEIFLGDGLWASFDGWQIKLRAPRENGDHEVYFDVGMFDLLKKYASKCWASEYDRTAT
jgi:hypothetical protein